MEAKPPIPTIVERIEATPGLSSLEMDVTVEPASVPTPTVQSLAKQFAAKGDPFLLGKGRRFCPGCGKARKLEMFKREARRGRPACTFEVCMPCRTRLKKERRDAKEESLRRKAAQMAIQQILKGASHKQATIGDVASALLTKFGGVDSFAEEYYSEIQKTRMDQHANRKTVQDAYKEVAAIIRAGGEGQKGQSLDHMSTEEIMMLLESQAARLIGSHPDLFRELALQQGLVVELTPEQQAVVAAREAQIDPSLAPEFSI